MSTLDAELEVGGAPVGGAGIQVGEAPVEVTAAREARVGDMAVRRLLPLRLRRSVGAWCFIDHYGPMSVDGVAGMQVPPHPHIGLQTVTWLMSGNVLHRDSLGSEQMIRPGQLNLMTAGRGIAHAEESPPEHDPQLHGVQLWVALPDATRLTQPGFEHHAQLPDTGTGGFAITVFMGALAGVRSPARTFSDLVGAELAATTDASARIPLAPEHEHVIFVTDGAAAVHVAGSAAGQAGATVTGSAHRPAEADPGGTTTDAGTELHPGQLLYLSTGRDQVMVSAARGSRLFLLGGVPLGEPLLMWWNFVARTPDEIAAARSDWADGRFGAVGGYRGDPLPAPPLDPARLRRPAR